MCVLKNRSFGKQCLNLYRVHVLISPWYSSLRCTSSIFVQDEDKGGSLARVTHSNFITRGSVSTANVHLSVQTKGHKANKLDVDTVFLLAMHRFGQSEGAEAEFCCITFNLRMGRSIRDFDKEKAEETKVYPGSIDWLWICKF